MSDSVVRMEMETVCGLAAKRAAYSASPALATTHGIIEDETWI